MRLLRLIAWVGIVLFVVLLRPGLAEVVRVEVRERGPFADGHVFGRSGAYEKIAGRLHFEVDPEDPANARVNTSSWHRAMTAAASSSGAISFCWRRPIRGGATGDCSMT